MTGVMEPSVSGASQGELLAELARVEQQLARAKQRRDRDAICYASTPDGAAETYRRFELAGHDHADRKRLKTVYLSGLTMSAEEHQERVRLGNASAGDGPLAVIPVGLAGGDPVVRVLVEHRIMGTYRNSSEALHTGRITVSLLRLLPSGERKRMRLDAAAELGVLAGNLAEVLVQAWGDPRVQKRLRSFLDDAGDAFSAAVAEHGAL